MVFVIGAYILLLIIISDEWTIVALNKRDLENCYKTSLLWKTLKEKGGGAAPDVHPY